MFVHKEGEFHFGAASVGAGQEHGVVHRGDPAEVEGAGEAAQAAENFGAEGAGHVRFHQFDGAVAGFDVDAGVFIVHSCSPVIGMFREMGSATERSRSVTHAAVHKGSKDDP